MRGATEQTGLVRGGFNVCGWRAKNRSASSRNQGIAKCTRCGAAGDFRNKFPEGHGSVINEARNGHQSGSPGILVCTEAQFCEASFRHRVDISHQHVGGVDAPAIIRSSRDGSHKSLSYRSHTAVRYGRSFGGSKNTRGAVSGLAGSVRTNKFRQGCNG